MDDVAQTSDLASLVAPLGSAYLAVAARLLAAWTTDAGIVRVALGGSIGSGRADAHSDLDLSVAVADESVADRLVEALPEAVGAVYIEVLARGPVRIFTAVTADWLRVDVVVEPLAVAVGRPRQPEAVVLDRVPNGIAFASAAPLAPPPDLLRVVESFLRIFGLLPVALGRGEYFVGTQGVMLLREHLVDVFAIENGGIVVGGVKRLNPSLTDEQRTLLEGQPALRADGQSLRECHAAAAAAFLPRARALAQRDDVAWPAEFEAATLAHLRAAAALDSIGGSGTIQP